MLRFKNRNAVSVTPRTWKSPSGKKIAWRADTTQFSQFVAAVQAYCQQNNFPVPSAEELEDLMCRQSPSRDCTGDANYHSPPVQHYHTEPGSRGGCRSCGGRK